MSVREKLEAARAEAIDAVARNENGSRDWWLARFWALEYALEVIE